MVLLQFLEMGQVIHSIPARVYSLQGEVSENVCLAEAHH